MSGKTKKSYQDQDSQQDQVVLQDQVIFQEQDNRQHENQIESNCMQITCKMKEEHHCAILILDEFNSSSLISNQPEYSVYFLSTTKFWRLPA